MAKTSPINMRVEPEQHSLLSKAAAVLQKDRTSFILDVACREAENVLLDQRLFQLEESKFNQFSVAIDSPATINPSLKNLLKQKSPWE